LADALVSVWSTACVLVNPRAKFFSAAKGKTFCVGFIMAARAQERSESEAHAQVSRRELLWRP